VKMLFPPCVTTTMWGLTLDFCRLYKKIREEKKVQTVAKFQMIHL